VINTERQLLLGKQNKEVEKNILIKRLSSLNKKLPVQDVNLLFLGLYYKHTTDVIYNGRSQRNVRDLRMEYSL
jgi:hypothetical protein